MEYVRYTNKEINNAGLILATKDNKDDLKSALYIINEWRHYHVAPLNTFQATLRNYSSSIDKNSIVVQRLKKMASITYKLKRFPDMKLSRMQDVGGCRVILSDINCVYRLEDKIKNSRMRHKLVNQKDYIKEPKPSGYRGIHLIYKYHSDRNHKWDDLQIEIQIRTYLQHIWATTVETVGIFTKNSLKSSEGPEEWLRFFILMSSIFAIEENSNCIPNTSCNLDELVKEIKILDKQNGFLTKLQGYNATLNYLETPKFAGNDYYILTLKYSNRNLSIKSYSKKEADKANEYYIELEKTEKANGNDVVLVSASSIDNLKRAYPNYFLDTKEFSSLLEKYLNK